MRGFTRGKGEKRCNYNFKNKRKNKENYFPLPLPFWVDYCGTDTPRAMIFHFQTNVLISGQSPSTRLGWWALETRCLLFTARSLKTHIRIRALPSPPHSLPRCFLPALPSLPSPPLSPPSLSSVPSINSCETEQYFKMAIYTHSFEVSCTLCLLLSLLLQRRYRFLIIS